MVNEIKEALNKIAEVYDSKFAGEVPDDTSDLVEKVVNQLEVASNFKDLTPGQLTILKNISNEGGKAIEILPSKAHLGHIVLDLYKQSSFTKPEDTDSDIPPTITNDVLEMIFAFAGEKDNNNKIYIRGEEIFKDYTAHIKTDISDISDKQFDREILVESRNDLNNMIKQYDKIEDVFPKKTLDNLKRKIWTAASGNLKILNKLFNNQVSDIMNNDQAGNVIPALMNYISQLERFDVGDNKILNDIQGNIKNKVIKYATGGISDFDETILMIGNNLKSDVLGIVKKKYNSEIEKLNSIEHATNISLRVVTDSIEKKFKDFNESVRVYNTPGKVIERVHAQIEDKVTMMGYIIGINVAKKKELSGSDKSIVIKSYESIMKIVNGVERDTGVPMNSIRDDINKNVCQISYDAKKNPTISYAGK